MTSALEREVIEKFKMLDADAKQRVREMIEQETVVETDSQPVSFNFDTWWKVVEANRIPATADVSGRMLNASDLVNEVREELDARG